MSGSAFNVLIGLCNGCDDDDDDDNDDDDFHVFAVQKSTRLNGQ